MRPTTEIGDPTWSDLQDRDREIRRLGILVDDGAVRLEKVTIQFEGVKARLAEHSKAMASMQEQLQTERDEAVRARTALTMTESDKMLIAMGRARDKARLESPPVTMAETIGELTLGTVFGSPESVNGHVFVEPDESSEPDWRDRDWGDGIDFWWGGISRLSRPPLSVRALNNLRTLYDCRKCTSWRTLALLSEHDLLETRNCGKKSVREIRDLLTILESL